MKKALSVLVLIIIGLTANSCQNDDSSGSQKLDKSSTLTTLLLRVTHHSGQAGRSGDENEALCFAVSLPVTITSGGQTITVTNEADYWIVLAALGNFDEDNTATAFVFPLNIIFADGTTHVINNAQDLENAMDSCEGDDDDDNNSDDDIECMDIAYPISITYTDPATGASQVTFNGDSDLYAFLSNLDDNDTLTINYPITITDATGVTVSVNNNDELESAIEDADLACNGDGSDDDNDGDNNDDNGNNGNRIAHK